MTNKKWLSFLMLLIFIGVTGACSKKLLPPEMEAQGSVSESSVAQFGGSGAGSIGASDFGAGGNTRSSPSAHPPYCLLLSGVCVCVSARACLWVRMRACMSAVTSYT